MSIALYRQDEIGHSHKVTNKDDDLHSMRKGSCIPRSIATVALVQLAILAILLKASAFRFRSRQLVGVVRESSLELRNADSNLAVS